MKAFVIYTLLRLLLFVATYAVLAGLWTLVVGRESLLVAPFIGAVVVSSLLSLKLLARQREAFAQSVQARATRATEHYEEMRAREDVD